MQAIDLRKPIDDPIFALIYGGSGTGKTTLIAVMPASPTLLPTKYPSTIEYMPERANARIDGITKRKNFFEYIKISISKIFFI